MKIARYCLHKRNQNFSRKSARQIKRLFTSEAIKSRLMQNKRVFLACFVVVFFMASLFSFFGCGKNFVDFSSIEHIERQGFLNTWVTAHAGSEGTKGDTLKSIDMALSLTDYIDIIEIDINEFNGELLYAHDPIRSQRQANRKLTIRYIFERVKPTNLKINCDIKQVGLMKPVLALADEVGIARERIKFTGSVTKEQIREIDCRDFMVYVNFDFFGKNVTNRDHELIKNMLAKYLSDFLRHGLNINFRDLTPELYKFTRQNNIELSIWTVNDIRMVEQLIRLQVDNITTKIPRAARGALR